MKKIVPIILCVMLAMSFMGCSGSGNDYDTSNNSSLSKGEQQRRSAEEEASHYYYDKNGHIHDDRD